MRKFQPGLKGVILCPEKEGPDKTNRTSKKQFDEVTTITDVESMDRFCESLQTPHLETPDTFPK